MRAGDCVYNEDSWSRAVAHCIRLVTADRVLSECGKWMRYAALTHNHSRREPCESCAAAIERRNTAEKPQNRFSDTIGV